SEKGYSGGLRGLIQLAERLGEENGLALRATTDAKFLEVGFGTKSDNVDTILKQIGLSAEECCFWGDEFLKMDEGIYGSDSYFITAATKTADFFDVSEAAGERPACVKQLGGSVERFLSFLREQSPKL
ncbi:MAG: HAD family hydrolase, partial [Clostridiales bacterium]|nr:HAD family hydrolase [Clostridiales bacterium]